MNRKERYYTGTVLPMIIAGDAFTHLHRFLALAGPTFAAGLDVRADPLQFLTEYSFAESVYLEAERTEFADRPPVADTPDLVITGGSWLVAVEAKMFHNPDTTALTAQLGRQRVLLDYWAEHASLPASRVAHVALLPAGLVKNLEPDELPAVIVTWEAVAVAYAGVAPAYWLDVLHAALDEYDARVSRASLWRHHSSAVLAGSAILERHRHGEGEFTWMGRSGGLGGDLLAGDIAGGGWAKRKYEVREVPLPDNPNWFSIADFVALLPDQ